MPRYLVTGVDLETGHEVRRLFAAPSETEAEALAVQEGLDIRSREIVGEGGVVLEQRQDARALGHYEIYRFCDAMAAWLAAGQQDLDAVAEIERREPSARVRHFAAEIHRAMKQESLSLAMALAESERVPPMVVGLTQAAEQGADLADMFRRLAAYYQGLYQLRRELLTNMIQPAVSIIMLGGMVLGALIFGVPALDDMFRKLNVEVGGMFSLIAGVSAALRTFWILGLALIGGVIYAAVVENPLRRFLREWVIWKFGICRQLFHKARELALLRTIEVVYRFRPQETYLFGLLESMFESTRLGDELKNARDYFARDPSFPRAIERNMLSLDPRVLFALRTGDQTGRIAESMARMVETYERELPIAAREFSSTVTTGTIFGVGILAALAWLFMMGTFFSMGLRLLDFSLR